ncbi:hypothetical protein SFRURICE_011859 [Spodoptera frugiperda]|nr:hypothetical protein SFRURICE_011859 [Spodoptera frugiperda]
MPSRAHLTSLITILIVLCVKTLLTPRYQVQRRWEIIQFLWCVTKMAATVATGRCSVDVMAVWLVDNSKLQKNRRHQIEWSYCRLFKEFLDKPFIATKMPES